MATAERPVRQAEAGPARGGRPARGLLADAGRRFARNRAALAGAGLLVGFLLLAMLGPLLAPHDPLKPDLGQALLPGPWDARGLSGHLLGTDSLGRDVLSRILVGARVSVSVGFITVLLAMALGVPIGCLAGYLGGAVDRVLMAIMDVLFAFPAILLAVVILATLGPGLEKAVLAVAIVYTPRMARVVRGSVLSIRAVEYVGAARALGATGARIMLRHVLPNALAPIVVQATFSVAGAILATAGLGFIGLGAQPPSPEWGAQLIDSRNSLLLGKWWAATFPGLAIMLLVLALNLAGDGLRDALDPRLTG